MEKDDTDLTVATEAAVFFWNKMKHCSLLKHKSWNRQRSTDGSEGMLPSSCVGGGPPSPYLPSEPYIRFRMKKVYEPLNMVMNGRYAVLYGKLDPAVQQEVLSRMAGLIEEGEYEDIGNYGNLHNIDFIRTQNRCSSGSDVGRLCQLVEDHSVDPYIGLGRRDRLDCADVPGILL